MKISKVSGIESSEKHSLRLFDVSIAAIVVLCALIWILSYQKVYLASSYPKGLMSIPGDEPAEGFASRDAAYFNKVQPGLRDGSSKLRILYLAPYEKSLGPNEVSIDSSQPNVWSAVSRSIDGNCYALLIYSAGNDAKERSASYDIFNWTFPSGQICSANRATLLEARRHSA